jgi:hypothetical protein
MNRVLVTGGMLLLASLAARAAELPEDWRNPAVAYEGTRLIQAGGHTISSKFHYAPPGKHRQEMDQGGMQIVTILREDKGVVWSIIGPGMYMETAFGEEVQGRDPGRGLVLPDDTEVVEFEELGRETVNGVDTTRYRILMRDDERDTEGLYWLSDEKIPMRMQVTPQDGSYDTVTIETTDLSIEPQADELFELPAGAQAMSMGNLGALFGMGSGEQPATDTGEQPATGAAVQPAAAGETEAAGSDDPGFAGEVATEAQDTAAETTKEEVRRGVKDTVKKGLKGLFGGG